MFPVTPRAHAPKLSDCPGTWYDQHHLELVTIPLLPCMSARGLHSLHLVADFGKLFSINANTFVGLSSKIGSFIALGSILYFFL
jgi:hypothetical protein